MGAALDGSDMDEGSIHWPVQVCAILPFQSPGTGCLTRQQPTGDLTGVSLRTTGVTAASAVPEVIATEGPGSEVLLTPADGPNNFVFKHDTGSDASLTVKSTDTLTSAIIYGRA